MGSSFSFDSLSADEIKHVSSFKAVGLSEADVGELRGLYIRWCNPNSEMSFNDFMSKLHSKPTNFTRKVFSMENESATTAFPFHKFVLGLWNFCTLDDKALGIFIFELYSGGEDGDGIMDLEKFKVLMKDIHRDDKRTSKKYPECLNPALLLREIFIEMTCGRKFWERMSDNRKNIDSGYVSKEVLLRRANRIVRSPCGEECHDDKSIGRSKKFIQKSASAVESNIFFKPFSLLLLKRSKSEGPKELSLAAKKAKKQKAIKIKRVSSRSLSYGRADPVKPFVSKKIPRNVRVIEVTHRNSV